MQHESKQVPQDPSSAQRIIVLIVLEHDDGIARSALNAEVDDLDPNAVRDALMMLAREGVIVADDERVQASRCARHLDALSLICV